MAARSRSIPDSRIHGKKHDFAPARSTSASAFTSMSASLFRLLKSLRRRRVVLSLLTLWLLYLFFKHMPTDVPSVRDRYDSRFGRLSPAGGDSDQNPSNGRPMTDNDQSYEGPIKYYELGKTLRGATRPASAKGSILFAVSKLDSIPRLLPFACSMVHTNRTRVHFAFMGRQIANWDDVRALNGVAETDCDLFLHDARPDNAAQSSANRLDVSARASLGHMHSALRLDAVFVADSDLEEVYLVDGLREKSASMRLSLVVLPAGGTKGLSWVSSLDAQSLSHVNDISVEIIIHAQTEASANVLRLLRSISEADYSGWSLPRLTIELPARPDSFLTQYLTKFQWPPGEYPSESKLVLRHRVDTRAITPAQALMRTVEAFYPVKPSESHVLVVSPDVELAPGYFQYLMYTLLEYRYAAQESNLAGQMVGISLDLPDRAPDAKTKAPWKAVRIPDPLVLWQAPNSNAGLYFGDKWVELHSFAAARLTADPELLKKTPSSPVLSQKLPGWLRLMLEMMQVKKYYMLYPTFVQSESRVIANLHKELVQRPEEFVDAHGKSEHRTGEQVAGSSASELELTADAEIRRLEEGERNVFPTSLVTVLQESVALQQTDAAGHPAEIPLISFHGEQLAATEALKDSWKFAAKFAEAVGGCTSDRVVPVADKLPQFEELFCPPIS